MSKWYLKTGSGNYEFSKWVPSAIAKHLPGVTLPGAEPAAVSGDGWNLLPLTDNGPTLEPYQIVASRAVTDDGTTATASYTVGDKVLAEYKAERKADLAALRYDHEVGGTTISGMAVSTDRETQSKLIAARIMAKEDAAYTVAWKGPTGFATLDAATIIAVADGVRGHVQACFDREAALTADIDAATTVQAVAAVDITTGWPT